MTQYRKAKKWKGKDLSLHVGAGDKRILDGDVLTGDHWDRFVGLGFLERVPADQEAAPKSAPAKATAPASAPVPAPTPAREGGMTRSSAGKAEAASKGGKPGKGGKGKGHAEEKAPSTEETDKAFAEKAAELAAGNDDLGGVGDSAGTAPDDEKKAEPSE